MNLSYGTTCSAITECIPQGLVERSIFATEPVQHEVKRGGSKTKIPPLPVVQIVAPRTPEFRGVAGDFESVVANEEEVVCGPSYRGKAVVTGLRDDDRRKMCPRVFGGTRIRKSHDHFLLMVLFSRFF